MKVGVLEGFPNQGLHSRRHQEPCVTNEIKALKQNTCKSFQSNLEDPKYNEDSEILN
jgi:hypothetical protein